MSDESSRHLVELFLHDQIPLTRAMAVRVAGNDARGFTLEAPVSANSNHLRTAFGGSINAVATLAGYGLLWLELGENSPVHLVVAESSIRFLRPVRETIRATCLRPPEEDLRAFLVEVGRGQRARIRLQTVVEEGGATAADFTGTFAALSEARGQLPLVEP